MIWPGMPSRLYRINGGPELTAGQLEDVAGRLANVGKT